MTHSDQRPEPGRTIIVVRDRAGRELDRAMIAHPLTISATLSALARLRAGHQQRARSTAAGDSSGRAAP